MGVSGLGRGPAWVSGWGRAVAVGVEQEPSVGVGVG